MEVLSFIFRFFWFQVSFTLSSCGIALLSQNRSVRPNSHPRCTFSHLSSKPSCVLVLRPGCVLCSRRAACNNCEIGDQCGAIMQGNAVTFCEPYGPRELVSLCSLCVLFCTLGWTLWQQQICLHSDSSDENWRSYWWLPFEISQNDDAFEFKSKPFSNNIQSIKRWHELRCFPGWDGFIKNWHLVIDEGAFKNEAEKMN